MNPENWYFTFGVGQGKLANKYVKIYKTFNEARREMMDMFGNRWAFQYDEEEFLPQIKRFELKELKLDDEE